MDGELFLKILSPFMTRRIKSCLVPWNEIAFFKYTRRMSCLFLLPLVLMLFWLKNVKKFRFSKKIDHLIVATEYEDERNLNEGESVHMMSHVERLSPKIQYSVLELERHEIVQHELHLIYNPAHFSRCSRKRCCIDLTKYLCADTTFYNLLCGYI